MKKLLVYLKDYKRECVLAPLFKLLEASFELIVPLVMASIIDRGIAGRNRPYSYRMGAILVALALVGLVCSVTAQYFAARAAVGFAAKLRHTLFSHIERLSFQELDAVGTSTLITRMTSDVNQVQSGVNMVLRLFLRSPFIVLGAMVMAFTVNVRSALVFVVAIPLLSIVVFSIMVYSIPMFRRVQNCLDTVLLHTRENLSGARVIRAFCREEREREQFHADNDRLADLQLAVGRVSALMNPLTYIIVCAATFAVIWIGAGEVHNGILTTGEVVALVNYMSQILVELVKLANLILLINKSVACGGRIQEVLELKPGIAGAALPASSVSGEAPAVAFSHVCMSYQDSKEALTDISFSVRKGQTVGIIGGTGSGKSSVVNLIPRFYEVSSGAVSVDGRDVRSYELRELRKKVGVVMQNPTLFAGTLSDNLRWGREDAAEEELWEALELAQAKDVAEQKEGGLGFWIGQGGRNLSGGQKQRLSIARALVRKPGILILDDSASALDFATDARLRAALRTLAGETTLFLVSQRTSSIRHADVILVMDDGRLVGTGTHEELLRTCSVYREIHESQYKKEEEPGGAQGGR